MLVLSRKAGEAVLIGDRIKLTVRSIAGKRVHVAIDAPQDVHILRGELKKKPVTVEKPERATTSRRARRLVG